ncbi:MAG: transporter substrate-binding domain-containing protein [Lachnospiraceae bacterium]|nr:transporter substrate-binding domain-containing protein [Lachnospiraceae bacterium]MBQ7780576.1 transporter substrate-binding domain-containing protein [Lachnospiraceae bacterium]
MKKLLAMVLTSVLAATMLVGCGGEAKTAKVIEIELTQEEYAFGVDKTQPELLESVNTFIAEIKDNGVFDEICNNYFGDGTPVAVTSAELDPNKEQLVVATNAAFEPFEYKEGDKYYGIDMEIAARLADYLGQELVIQNMEFDAVCLSVGQQKCDIAMAGLTIKPDREEYVTFSDSYYSASQKLIVTSDNTEFDGCADAAAVEAILNEKASSVKVGVQNGTTGQFYAEGDAEWGFAGFEMTVVGYKNGALAVQDLLNGNIDYVIIDSAPAACITEAINEMQ